MVRVTAAALFAVALLVRLPFRVEYLWAHDSVLYARAIEDFDPAAQRPHPPGYLWYVLLARGVTTLTGDANEAMTLIAAVAGAAAVALLYLVSRAMYDERTGVVAALFLMTSVTFWGESAVAYPYTLLAALTTLLALLFWRSRLAVASLVWGVAIGFRTDLAVALAPVWVASAWAAPWRERALAATAVAVPVAAWIVAAGVETTGGVEGFVRAVQQQAAGMRATHSVFAKGLDGLAANVSDTARLVGWGLLAMIPLLAVAAASRLIQRVAFTDRRRTAFLLAWALAPFGVFLFLHIGEYGHAFSALPGLALIAARSAVGLAGAVSAAIPARASRSRAPLVWIAGVVMTANAVLFLFQFSDAPLSANDLAKRDQGIADKIAYVRTLDPERTLILTAYDQLLIEHYLPRYRYVAYEPHISPVFTQRIPCPAELCPRRVKVVLWDDLLRAEGDEWAVLAVRRGAHLRLIDTQSGRQIRVRDRHTVAIAP